MTISEYLLTAPYYLLWKTDKLLSTKSPLIDFYIGELMDYHVMKPIMRHFPSARVVAKNFSVRSALRKEGVDAVLWPTLPDVVIMARHALHEYPIRNVIKIGMSHGTYMFKNFIAAKKYNAFARYMLTSQEVVEMGKKTGIHSAVAIGYPKLDQAFNGQITASDLNELRRSLQLDPSKPTILFSATWDKSGMSAIGRWHDRVDELTSKYNILVTLHPFMSAGYINSIKNKSGIHYVDNDNDVPYLMLADLLVSDTSSIIAEFCAFNKPIVTFRVEKAKRLSGSIKELIASISVPVDSFDQLPEAIDQALTNDQLAPARESANKRFYLALDGQASTRAANEIRNILKEHGFS